MALNIENLPFALKSTLSRQLKSPSKRHEIVGTNSMTALATLLCLQVDESTWPQVVVLPNPSDVERLRASIAFFDPNVPTFCLPAYDVDPYSGLYPARQIMGQRLSWCHRAQQAKAGEVFIASIEALSQASLPPEVLKDHSWSFGLQEDLPPEIFTILEEMGYQSVPLVDDVGTYSRRGGIVDIYSPAHPWPVRLELFGDNIESIKLFDPATQRSQSPLSQVHLIPPREVIYQDEGRQAIAQQLKASCEQRGVNPDELLGILTSVAQGQYFHGVDFLLPLFYQSPGERRTQPLDHFSNPICHWHLDYLEETRQLDELIAERSRQYEEAKDHIIRPLPRDLYFSADELRWPNQSKEFRLSKIHIEDRPQEDLDEGLTIWPLITHPLRDFSQQAKALSSKASDLAHFAQEKILQWRSLGYKVFIAAQTHSQCQRLKLLLESEGSSLEAQIVDESDYTWLQWWEAQNLKTTLIHILPRHLEDSLRFQDEQVVFLREDDFFGHKRSSIRKSSQPRDVKKIVADISFADLKPGDFIVHKAHGVGLYQGLKVMPIQGVDAEFIELSYKGNDKLYLPVYRVGQIQKFVGPTSTSLIDKLGGQQWEKTKVKVKNHLREIADELLRIYSQRAQAEKIPFSAPDEDFLSFEAAFAFEETPDQMRAIEDVIQDMTSTKPMDRLICGDVGFGKTEVAMRAAFKAVQDGKQVALICPTTILSFQHAETFRKRFKKWPVKICSLNRFVQKKALNECLNGLKTGEVDIVIGTHRLLSKDVVFKDLGLLIIDEEQKFGVRHKESLKKMKATIDNLSMSATPIPRTFNMSLMGVRDLSLINTAPIDRLPTRTFVCKFDQEIIRKAVMSEISRGGQIYFIHNRVQSIYALADELRAFLPEVKIRVGHGQMDQAELEKNMLAFFNHEIDLLLCTTIVESGMDIPRANTMFINEAHQFGLSQLYQLRGRVGRAKERAYCYLLVPPHKRIDSDAQERLKALQENTALGSGIRIAHHDLELRGAGNFLGEEQSGHANAVGYDLYLELLEEAIQLARGGTVAAAEVEPEINLRIPALIPDKYISDIRQRLVYYRALSSIRGPEDVEQIEADLRDQYGKLPEEVINLMGLMLIRLNCKKLGIRDISAGKIGLSLAFTPQTPLTTDRVIELSTRPNKKYSITPDSRLIVRMHEITWPKVYDELNYLTSLCPNL